MASGEVPHQTGEGSLPAAPTPAGTLAAIARNALEVARLGGLETGETSSPHEVTHRDRVYRLRRYFPGGALAARPPRQDRRSAARRPAILLVPPMMLSAEVWDVSAATSGVRHLAEAGIDPWVIDFGAPEHEAGGMERTLTDHVVAISDAIDRVNDTIGGEVHLGGYSQGGMFCYQAAAYRRSHGIASIVTFGSPVDTLGMVPFGLPDDLVSRAAELIGRAASTNLYVPAWLSRTGFRLLDPAKALRQRVEFVRQLHDRESLLPRERQRRFLMDEGWVAWPGPALAELLQQIVAHNRMLSGGFVIQGRSATLADIDVPVLCFVGEADEIAPPRVVRALKRAAPRAETWECTLPGGHFGLVVGTTASELTWPTVAAWLHWRAGRGDPPRIRPLADSPGSGTRPTSTNAAVEAIGIAANLGLATARAAGRLAMQAGRNVETLARNVSTAWPRIARLERVGPATRVSLGLLLDEQAARDPDATFFLFDGRGHSYGDAKRRIDNVVRGLIAAGVRQGDHVGVLMDMRPSALAAVAALNRLGAVAVMLRAGGSVEREARLGGVRRLVSDPEHAGEARAIPDVATLVLGGGGQPRELGPGVTDLEQIDPTSVALPGWYRPNPGRAQDLAYICFTGSGEQLRANHITNRRWTLSAFGTASAAALSSADTVYSVAPLHHPSGLLTSIGGAVAGGARLAITGHFAPESFWDEVRRYGVTVVSYTWTLVAPLLDAPPSPLEVHHPVRLFAGSGMPRGLWRRLLDRFAPARVLEFYASTEGRGVLVNMGGGKPGSKGRQLPGSADLRVAAYDTGRQALEEGPDGFAVECRPGKVGMLLVRADRDTAGNDPALLRGVFRRDDAWLATGDMFSVDVDGDHWLVGAAGELIHTAGGVVGPRAIEDGLADLAGASLVCAYGVQPPRGPELSVAAVTLQPGAQITRRELEAVTSLLPAWQRPDIVRIVPEIPATTWHRLQPEPLRAEGIVAATGQWPVWLLDRRRGLYEKLTPAKRERLMTG